MLVLSRKKNEQILFPNLGIEVEILRIAGNAVGVGIKAPKSVQILRGELHRPDQTTAASTEDSKSAASDLTHRLRNQLHRVQLAAALVEKQLARGRTKEAEATLQQLLVMLDELDRGIMPKTMPDAAQCAASFPPGQNHRASGSGRALVVEDDSNERTLLAGYLRLCGYQVSEAVDGREAMAMLREQDVDLVVLDMRMPHMNGAETVAAIRQQPRLKDVRIVVVSGEDRDDAMMAGDGGRVSQWFSKPLNPELLVQHLTLAGA